MYEIINLLNKFELNLTEKKKATAVLAPLITPFGQFRSF